MLLLGRGSSWEIPAVEFLGATAMPESHARLSPKRTSHLKGGTVERALTFRCARFSASAPKMDV